MTVGISPKSAVVTKGLKIRVKTHFVRMASLQRISSVRKVFQNQGSVVRMMSNDTGRSAGMCFEFLSYLSHVYKFLITSSHDKM